MSEKIRIFGQTSRALLAHFCLLLDYPVGLPNEIDEIITPESIASGTGVQVVQIRSQIPGGVEFFLAKYTFRLEIGTFDRFPMKEVELVGNTTGRNFNEGDMWRRKLQIVEMIGPPRFVPFGNPAEEFLAQSKEDRVRQVMRYLMTNDPTPMFV